MKTAQINIGGELRTLDFSRAGLYDHIQEASGKPAFEFLDSLKESAGSKEMSVLIYAGLNSHLDVEGKDNIKLGVVVKWLRAVETEKLAEVYNTVISAMSTGEVESQPGGSD